MKLSDLLLTAGSNMLRARVRTILTVVAIVIGAMTITLTNGIGSGVKSYLNQQIGDLGARNVLFVQLSGSSNSPNSAPAKYRYNPRGVITSSGLGQTQSAHEPARPRHDKGHPRHHKRSASPLLRT